MIASPISNAENLICLRCDRWINRFFFIFILFVTKSSAKRFIIACKSVEIAN